MKYIVIYEIKNSYGPFGDTYYMFFKTYDEMIEGIKKKLSTYEPKMCNIVFCSEIGKTYNVEINTSIDIKEFIEAPHVHEWAKYLDNSVKCTICGINPF